MLSKEATIRLCVDHLRAGAVDDIRLKFSAVEEEEFAYELGVHIGSAIAKLFVDDPEETAACVEGLRAYLGSFESLATEYEE
jgi:hypothetical protein